MSVNRCFVTKTRFLEPESIDQAFIKGWKVHCFKDSVSFLSLHIRSAHLRIFKFLNKEFAH